MNKIWYFGDSYIAKIHSLDAKSWTEIVSDSFPNYTNENIGKPCSSLDYLYHTYEKNSRKFKKGDVVVMTLTTLHRLFLNTEDKDNPSFMNVSFRHTPEGLIWHKEGDEYYDYFVSEFFNKDAAISTLNNFIKALQYDVINKKIKVIVLPTDNYNFDDTQYITMGRSSEKYTLKKINSMLLSNKIGNKAEKYKGNLYALEEAREYDRKLANHLDLENNQVLAEKVIQAIKTNSSEIDLTTGWKNI